MTSTYTRRDAEALRSHYRSAGYVSIPDFLDSQELSSLKDQLARTIDVVVPDMPAEDVYWEDVTNEASLKQLQRLHVHDPELRKWLVTGPFARLAAILLEDEPAPQNLQYFNKAPGVNRPTPSHQDGAYFAIAPMNAVTIWLALENVSPEQGCVRYVPGSHLDGLRPHTRGNTLGFSREIADYGAEDIAREQAFPCEAGHVIAHHALTVHRADGNASPDLHRRALGFIYFGAACAIDKRARDEYQRQLDQDLRRAGRLELRVSQ